MEIQKKNYPSLFSITKIIKLHYKRITRKKMLLSVLPLLLSLHLFLARSPYILINCFQTSLGSIRGNGRSMMCPFLRNFHSSVLPWALVLRVLEDLENIIFSDLLFEFITSLISIPGFNQGSWRGPVNTIQDCLTPVVLQGWGKVCSLQSSRAQEGRGTASLPRVCSGTSLDWAQLRFSSYPMVKSYNQADRGIGFQRF